MGDRIQEPESEAEYAAANPEAEPSNDEMFTEAADHLMQAIDDFRTAGLSNDEIRKELDARLG